jgi:hypothetical protein
MICLSQTHVAREQEAGTIARHGSRWRYVLVLYLPDRTSCTRLLDQIFEIEAKWFIVLDYMSSKV